MSTSALPVVFPSHPSPHRSRVSPVTLLVAIWAGAAAWFVQLVVNYGLASLACYPSRMPLRQLPQGWGGVWYWLLALNVAAVAVALIAALVSHRIWRNTRTEHPGHAGHALEAGEGRTRFLGLVGVMMGWGFLLATVFDTIALFVVPQCLG